MNQRSHGQSPAISANRYLPPGPLEFGRPATTRLGGGGTLRMFPIKARFRRPRPDTYQLLLAYSWPRAHWLVSCPVELAYLRCHARLYRERWMVCRE
jgi:hypothetical protein